MKIQSKLKVFAVILAIAGIGVLFNVGPADAAVNGKAETKLQINGQTQTQDRDRDRNRDRVRPQTPSDEATAAQLRIADRQGRAYQDAASERIANAQSGGEKVVGDYIVGYVVNRASGYYVWRGNNLVWYGPGNNNTHIEVFVKDAAQRFLPYMNVRVMVMDSRGRRMGTQNAEFIWHPWFYHYASNWRIPSAGNYTIRIMADPPRFNRHDRVNGARYTRPINTEFTNVRIRPGAR